MAVPTTGSGCARAQGVCRPRRPYSSSQRWPRGRMLDLAPLRAARDSGARLGNAGDASRVRSDSAPADAHGHSRMGLAARLAARSAAPHALPPAWSPQASGDWPGSPTNGAPPPPPLRLQGFVANGSAAGAPLPPAGPSPRPRPHATGDLSAPPPGWSAGCGRPAPAPGGFPAAAVLINSQASVTLRRWRGTGSSQSWPAAHRPLHPPPPGSQRALMLRWKSREQPPNPHVWHREACSNTCQILPPHAAAAPVWV